MFFAPHYNGLNKNNKALTLAAVSEGGKEESSSPPKEVAVSSEISAGGGSLFTFPASMELSLSE